MEENKMTPEFKGFQKISRLNRDIVISEKLDGMNSLVCITEDNQVFAGSKNIWLNDHEDNHGLWHWVQENKEELLKLGVGYHYGEWMGLGIRRNYGLKEKRFYLFNTHKWTNDAIRPKCCHVVPVLYCGAFEQTAILVCLDELGKKGSYAIPGFLNPEGIIIYHTASKQSYKVTLKNDEKPKGKNEE